MITFYEQSIRSWGHYKLYSFSMTTYVSSHTSPLEVSMFASNVINWSRKLNGNIYFLGSSIFEPLNEKHSFWDALRLSEDSKSAGWENTRTNNRNH